MRLRGLGMAGRMPDSLGPALRGALRWAYSRCQAVADWEKMAFRARPAPVPLLVAAVFRTLGVNASNAPVLWIEKYDNLGRKLPLNAYALDFYKHGSLKALLGDNRLNKGDAFNMLRDFSLTIKAIETSLGELCEDENDNVVLAFKQLAKSYKTKLDKV
uniref:ATP-dependent RNA helicase ddx60 n=1 Tax=Sphaerodactylus townsendi TaxID=933632 RepID=A0ACB8E783_9SAUR